MMGPMAKLLEVKRQDHLFIQFGIENRDVNPNIKRLNVSEEPDFKSVVEEYEQKHKKFIEENVHIERKQPKTKIPDGLKRVRVREEKKED